MHLSSDAKDLLVYKCTILTAMMRRLTSLFCHTFRKLYINVYKCTILTAMMRRLTSLFCHTFRKLTFHVNKINHKNVVKRGIYRMRRLILVFAIRTCYKCHFSCTCTAQLHPDHTAYVTKFTLYIPRDPKIV